MTEKLETKIEEAKDYVSKEMGKEFDYYCLGDSALNYYTEEGWFDLSDFEEALDDYFDEVGGRNAWFSENEIENKQEEETVITIEIEEETLPPGAKFVGTDPKTGERLYSGQCCMCPRSFSKSPSPTMGLGCYKKHLRGKEK